MSAKANQKEQNEEKQKAVCISEEQGVGHRGKQVSLKSQWSAMHASGPVNTARFWIGFHAFADAAAREELPVCCCELPGSTVKLDRGPYVLPWGVQQRDGKVVGFDWEGREGLLPFTLCIGYDKTNDLLIVPPNALVKALDRMAKELYPQDEDIGAQAWVYVLEEYGTFVDKNDLDIMVPELASKWKEALKAQEQAQEQAQEPAQTEPQETEPHTSPGEAAEPIAKKPRYLD
jgi:hypothetical protein